MTSKMKLRDGAVVDSSAIMSIFDKRASFQAFLQALKHTHPLYMAAPTYVELSMVVQGRKNAAGVKPLDDLLKALGVQIVNFDLPMAKLAQSGCAAYGKGHGPAALNMGDLFSYSLAVAKGLPLFFEGLDFFQTNVSDAMLILGHAFDAQHQPLPLDIKVTPGRRH